MFKDRIDRIEVKLEAEPHWFVYMLSLDGSSLFGWQYQKPRYYISHTADLETAVIEHDAGEVLLTRHHNPKLVWHSEPLRSEEAAKKRESALKKPYEPKMLLGRQRRERNIGEVL